MAKVNRKKLPVVNRFRIDARQLAKESLVNALLWVQKNEDTWAIVETSRALNLLKVARES